MLKRGRGATHAPKPQQSKPVVVDRYEFSIYDIPEEERQGKLDNNRAEKLLETPQMPQNRKVSTKYDASKFDFDDF